ncbi:hypothetical protein SAMN05421678_108297 [Actinopolymorpha cephalotaxi]|uniref:Restriction endonuclease n=1 Tax=Actinopolymorpha cephalotaxi TaxID=504797 RepID=A0A1I2US14_9ACTN|nr:hypothetical protein [Actinopolymorpha cephalotaxi]NYH86710.1 hypothetical protein [Actinopolymorpha cephalotaxi]SFG79853.1 hypothetical protein SAMN05421678_108297 [Actinopolymorpha cephalotaxi]
MNDQAAVNRSVLGRLLEELSWAGASIRAYRDGGRGYENVLTAEALAGLDFLPRQAFLGAVVSAGHGADRARMKFVGEVEEAVVTLLPDEFKLRPAAPTYQTQMVVQPDGIMVSPNCFVLIEAKRIRTSSFQPEQLAREYVTAVREAGDRTPLLLLILGSAPPVTVRGHGRMGIEEAVALHLESVVDRMDGSDLDPAMLVDQISDVFAWTTWHDVGRVVADQERRFAADDPSVVASVRRLAASVTQAIERHS